MNHNIRYEARHVDNLDFSIAVHEGTGALNFPYEDSKGESRLTVTAIVYNIELDLWWYSGGGANILHWTKTPPDPGVVFAPGNENPTNYEWPMTNPVGPFSPAAPFPFDGVYSIKKGDFTAAHDKLMGGGAEEWDVAAAGVIGNLPPGAGRQGYLIFIRGVGAPLGANQITEYLQLMPVEYNVNVIGWDGVSVSNSTSGFPNVNVSDWGDNSATLNVDPNGFLPDINVARYGNEHAQIDAANLIPHVNVKAVFENPAAASELEDFAINGYDSGTSQVEGVKEVDLIGAAGIKAASFDVKAIEEGAFDTGAISARVIETDAIDADAIAADAIGADAIADGAIDEPTFAADAISARVIATDAVDADAIAANAIDADAIADGAIDEPAFADNAISARVIATDAIDEDAIKIDSVTYEEISDSAVREIVSGIWSASVFGPIDYSVDPSTLHRNYAGSNYGLADAGTMGHAMLVAYLTKHISHASAHVGSTSTPMHTSKLSDPSGTKFYSKMLDSTPLIDPDETRSYIDRSAIIFKGLNSDGSVDANSQHHLVRISGVNVDADGQYFEIHLMDEDESSIPGGITAEAVIAPMSLGDVLVIKAETDATMHEVAHEVWEEPVADHSTPDTFGMLNRIIAGLSQYNHQITDSKYDPSGRLLSCRLVVYPTSDDARNGTNALTTIEVSSSYDEKQNMVSFASAEEK